MPVYCRLAVLIIAIASLTVMGVFIALGFYAWPSADDFCMAAGVQREGLLAHLWQHYLGWSGRYTGNALYAIFPLIFSMYQGYFLLPLLLLIALYLASLFLLTRIFRLAWRSPQVWLVGLGFIVLFLLGMKHTASSLYWLAGALTYQSGNILLLLALGLMIDLHDRRLEVDSRRAPLWWLLLVILLAVGSNEIAMMLMLGLCGWAVLVFGLHKSRFVSHWWWLLLAAVVASAVVYLAPGNAVREATFPLRHQWQRAVDGSLQMGGWIVTSWLFNPLMLVSLLLTPLAVSALAEQSPRHFNIRAATLWGLAGLTTSVPFVLQFPAWWAMGGWPPPRTVDAMYFVFLLSLLALVGALTLRFKPRLFASTKPALLLFVSLLWVAAIVIHPQMQRAWMDLTRRAPAFNAYMQQRQNLILQAREHSQPLLKLPAFSAEFPRSIYFNDIVPNARDWRNVCYAQYHGLQWVARAPQKYQRR